jgi:hypothetical protein
MYKSATKCNETLGKWCKNKHGASKIIDTFETYQSASALTPWRLGGQAASIWTSSAVRVLLRMVYQQAFAPTTVSGPDTSSRAKHRRWGGALLPVLSLGSPRPRYLGCRSTGRWARHRPRWERTPAVVVMITTRKILVN